MSVILVFVANTHDNQTKKTDFNHLIFHPQAFGESQSGNSGPQRLP
jgi:hypothetical protein